MKLNLGSGYNTDPAYVNVDCRPLAGVDVVWNLDIVPWPFQSVSCDGAKMLHTLEHLANPVAALRELVRVLKPGAEALVVVPHFASYLACYPGHKTMFGKTWFECLRDSSCNQDDARLDGCTVGIELRLWHYSVAWSPFWRGVWHSIERVLNATEQRQRFWEASGVLPPAEIWVTIRKNTEGQTRGGSRVV